MSIRDRNYNGKKKKKFIGNPLYYFEIDENKKPIISEELLSKEGEDTTILDLNNLIPTSIHQQNISLNEEEISEILRNLQKIKKINQQSAGRKRHFTWMIKKAKTNKEIEFFKNERAKIISFNLEPTKNRLKAITGQSFDFIVNDKMSGTYKINSNKLISMQNPTGYLLKVALNSTKRKLKEARENNIDIRIINGLENLILKIKHNYEILTKGYSNILDKDYPIYSFIIGQNIEINL
jgi:hypothetical protein